METKFTQQESLTVISEMIERSKNNIRVGSANSMILYGWAVAAIAITNFVLCFTLANPNQSFLVWWLMLPVATVESILKVRSDRSAIVRTQIDTIINAIWRGFAVANALFLMAVFAVAIVFHTWIVTLLITPVIMLMVGAAQYATSKACRYVPFKWSAVELWAGALLCVVSYMIFRSITPQFIILAATMITGFVVPGMMLNKKAGKNV